MNILIITTRAISLTTWIILSSNNPINLVLFIILITVLSSITISLIISPWFSLILLLIYIGGIIVIFSYFVRLRSNDSIIILKSNLHFLMLPVVVIETMNLQIYLPIFNKSQINELYLYKNTTILLFITLMLLTIIIIVAKIVKPDNGPLRGFNKL